MGVKYDIIAAGEKYTDQNGQEKTRFTKMGVCIETTKGLRLKIESIPVGFDGWASLMEPKTREDAPARNDSPRQQARPAPIAYLENLPF